MKKRSIITVSLVFIIVGVLFAVYGFGDTASGFVSGFQGTCRTDANCLSPRKCISDRCGCIASDCKSPEKCNAANGRCELGRYGAACTAGSGCISRLCVTNTGGRGMICGCLPTGNHCGPDETCDTATHLCRASRGAPSGAAYGAACTINTNCASNVCMPTTRRCGCSPTVGCGAGEYCDAAGTCRLGAGPPSAIDTLVNEINMLIINMKSRILRI